MDPLSALGAAGSVVGIASFGIQLSNVLYQFTTQAYAANESLHTILGGIHATTCALDSVHGFLQEECKLLESKGYATFFSPKAISDVKCTADKCLFIFWRIEAAITNKSGTKFETELVKRLELFNEELRKEQRVPVQPDPELTTLSKWGRLRWPYIAPKLEQYNSQLQLLQSNLVLIFQVVSLGAHRTKPNQRDEDVRVVVDLYHRILRISQHADLPAMSRSANHPLSSKSFDVPSSRRTMFPNGSSASRLDGRREEHGKSSVPSRIPGHRHPSISTVLPTGSNTSDLPGDIRRSRVGEQKEESKDRSSQRPRKAVDPSSRRSSLHDRYRAPTVSEVKESSPKTLTPDDLLKDGLSTFLNTKLSDSNLNDIRFSMPSIPDKAQTSEQQADLKAGDEHRSPESAQTPVCPLESVRKILPLSFNVDNENFGTAHQDGARISTDGSNCPDLSKACLIDLQEDKPRLVTITNDPGGPSVTNTSAPFEVEPRQISDRRARAEYEQNTEKAPLHPHREVLRDSGATNKSAELRSEHSNNQKPPVHMAKEENPFHAEDDKPQTSKTGSHPSQLSTLDAGGSVTDFTGSDNSVEGGLFGLLSRIFRSDDKPMDRSVSAFIIKNGNWYQVPQPGSLQAKKSIARLAKKGCYKTMAFMNEDDIKAIEGLCKEDNDGRCGSILHLERLKDRRLRFWKPSEQAHLAIIKMCSDSESSDDELSGDISSDKLSRRSTDHAPTLYKGDKTSSATPADPGQKTYHLYTMKATDDNDQRIPDWTVPRIDMKELQSTEVLRQIVKLDNDPETLSEKLSRLNRQQRVSITTLIQNCNDNEPDANSFKCVLVQLEALKKSALHSGMALVDRETLLVYVARIPVATVASIPTPSKGHRRGNTAQEHTLANVSPAAYVLSRKRTSEPRRRVPRKRSNQRPEDDPDPSNSAHEMGQEDARNDRFDIGNNGTLRDFFGRRPSEGVNARAGEADSRNITGTEYEDQRPARQSEFYDRAIDYRSTTAPRPRQYTDSQWMSSAAGPADYRVEVPNSDRRATATYETPRADLWATSLIPSAYPGPRAGDQPSDRYPRYYDNQRYNPSGYELERGEATETNQDIVQQLLLEWTPMNADITRTTTPSNGLDFIVAAGDSTRAFELEGRGHTDRGRPRSVLRATSPASKSHTRKATVSDAEDEKNNDSEGLIVEDVTTTHVWPSSKRNVIPGARIDTSPTPMENSQEQAQPPWLGRSYAQDIVRKTSLPRPDPPVVPPNGRVSDVQKRPHFSDDAEHERWRGHPELSSESYPPRNIDGRHVGDEHVDSGNMYRRPIGSDQRMFSDNRGLEPRFVGREQIIEARPTTHNNSRDSIPRNQAWAQRPVAPYGSAMPPRQHPFAPSSYYDSGGW